jgi:ribosomal protein L20A (L18A)
MFLNLPVTQTHDEVLPKWQLDLVEGTAIKAKVLSKFGGKHNMHFEQVECTQVKS